MCIDCLHCELDIEYLILPTGRKVYRGSHFRAEEAEPQRVACGGFADKRWNQGLPRHPDSRTQWFYFTFSSFTEV